MFYIRQKANYWAIEERLYNGAINFINLPTPDYFSRNSGAVVLYSGAIVFSMRVQDVVVPIGQTIDSFLSVLLNPSPNIQPGGGGGGNIEENEVEVNSGTYFVTASDKNIICTGNCTIVLPLTTSGKYLFMVWVRPNVQQVSVKGTGGETVAGETDIYLYGGEMGSFQNLLNLPDWALGR